jgi:hypothetical protein
MVGLRDEALATLGATRIDDFAPVGGRHASTKTVRTCAFEFAGLEGPLHGYSEGNGRKKAEKYVGFLSPMSNLLVVTPPGSPLDNAVETAYGCC